MFIHPPPATQPPTLPLHDALPILPRLGGRALYEQLREQRPQLAERFVDRKSTRLNSSHLGNSYAVFWWKIKKNGDPALLCQLCRPGPLEEEIERLQGGRAVHGDGS